MSGRAALEPATCPCGGSVDINPSWGGNRGQQTFYEVRCRKCGRVMDDYGDGRHEAVGHSPVEQGAREVKPPSERKRKPETIIRELRRELSAALIDARYWAGQYNQALADHAAMRRAIRAALEGGKGKVFCGPCWAKGAE